MDETRPLGRYICVPDKIVNKEELLDQVRVARAAGQTIVHCHGCFDIVHPGHVRYLEFARQQGDLLVVSLTSDCQVGKGVQRPYIPEEMRAENLAALEVVDLVYVNPNPTSADLLADLRPDVYVKGKEYEQNNRPDFARERQVVESYGGRVVFSSGDVVFSSTQLIESIGQDASLETERLKAVCTRHGIAQPSLRRLTEAFAGLRVLVIGDLVLDRYVLCDATELASEAPMMSLTRLEERVYIGGAGIVARHAAALGATVSLLSTVAADDSSKHAEHALAQESIASRLIVSRSRLPERTRFLVEASKVLRVEDSRSQPLDSVSEREAVAWVRSIADRTDAVIYCDFGCGTITSRLIEQLGGILHDRNRTVGANVSSPRGRLLDFRDVTLLCPTERDLRLARHDFDRGLSNVAWTAMDITRARHMMVTLGEKGLVVFDRQSQDPTSPRWRDRLRSEYLPSLADKVVDPLGAGDALLTTATLALAAGGNLMQAAYLGSLAAGIEATQLGNVPIDLAGLTRRLSARAELGGALPRGPAARVESVMPPPERAPKAPLPGRHAAPALRPTLRIKPGPAPVPPKRIRPASPVPTL